MSAQAEDLGEEAEYFDKAGECWFCHKDYNHCKCWDVIGKQHNSRHRQRTGHWFNDHRPYNCDVCIDERRAVTEEAKAAAGVKDEE